MSEGDAIERRLSAVERAIADGDGEISALAAAGDREQRLRAVEDRLESIEETITDLEAATQALRGYVGNVRSVNQDVEQRADAALAAVERLEERLDGSRASEPGRRGGGRRRADGTESTDDSARYTGGLNPHGSNGARSHESPGAVTAPDAETEMPVPGAGDGAVPSDRTDRDTNGDGVLDRVRDAL